VHLAADKPLRLELAQAGGEKPVRDARDGLAEFREEVRALAESPEDGTGPAFADQLHRVVEMRADGGATVGLARRRRSSFHPALRVAKGLPRPAGLRHAGTGTGGLESPLKRALHRGVGNAQPALLPRGIRGEDGGGDAALRIDQGPA
jgi:hypothetical protein